MKQFREWRGTRQYHTGARPFASPQLPALSAQPQCSPRPIRKEVRGAWRLRGPSSRWSRDAGRLWQRNLLALRRHCLLDPRRGRFSRGKSPPLSSNRRRYSARQRGMYTGGPLAWSLNTSCLRRTY